MDELKNLVIQTLESNGILGQLRAKLRSCVFKVIDSQDPSGRGNNLHWENPLAQKVLETTESAIAADLMREYMEFYRLDYTLAIFGPEANLPQAEKPKEEVARNAGLANPANAEPLLVQLIKAFKQNERPAAGAIQIPNVEKKPEADMFGFEKKQPADLPPVRGGGAGKKLDPIGGGAQKSSPPKNTAPEKYEQRK